MSNNDMSSNKDKIAMKNRIAEIDGDEMCRILWKEVKEKLLLPFIDLNVEYYDLSIQNREATKDKITLDAANAILRHKVGVKCATITANRDRQKEFNLSELYPSANATIRSVLDGTVFRKPVFVSCITPAVQNWKRPVIIARHAYGDVYKNVEMYINTPGKVELVFTGDNGEVRRALIADMRSPGVVQGVHNLDASIRSFARCCFALAVEEQVPLYFAAKDTISKIYDGRFKDIFREVYEAEFKDSGVEYSYSLIDDLIAKVIRSSGGFIWACKNYDGDVMSDMVANASGSLAMMTSVLVSPAGAYEFEAAHGTVQKHYYRYLKGETTSTNPTALIFAWTGALAKRAVLDGTPELAAFAKKLEEATLGVIESGVMTGDLTKIANPDLAGKKTVTSGEFIDAIAEKIK